LIGWLDDWDTNEHDLIDKLRSNDTSQLNRHPATKGVSDNDDAAKVDLATPDTDHAGNSLGITLATDRNRRRNRLAKTRQVKG
jgi:hypothetical protein